MSSGQTPGNAAAKALAQYVRHALRAGGAPSAAFDALNDWVNSDHWATDDPVVLGPDVIEYLKDWRRPVLRGVLNYLKDRDDRELPAEEDLRDLVEPLQSGDWKAIDDWFDRMFPL